ncbi:hypothetical protein EMIHUDRAFT_200603 [Emiliania huxleyi CCMP1516]|uniref:tRNA:m(4)X modification enzyme TRM13 n=3 Tax=Emiliania huxleyi TaxID=2903 RepID=A0A0D3KQU6_EMIH1|nr:hypothetical protein EMIHUDRAFT_200603 [Emiliania huxleyi CCMP1516]EOD38131.1 hypothetical protein EMIHUDRAFT_200603 [Emiliania huxleyi CCMP1516]|eukprot:XP_005790560.1 hypothetical protein EMIHUDRAFT_200603 [Emiliania huxleyi CCMP1516]
MARVCLPEPGVCELYLPNKRRYCRFSVVAGYRYCTHHLAARSDGTADRIPCPLDPAHSIFARDLRRHLKVCPKAKEAAAEASLPCFRRDVNAGEQLTAPGAPLPATAPAPTPIAGLPLHASLAVASRAEPPLGRVSAEREKHGLQHEAMLEVLRALPPGSMLGSGFVYVELGAGKGGLSAAIGQAAPGAAFVLLDWAKPVAAHDAVLRERHSTIRYKIDLRHLWLRGGSGGRRRVAVAKHLCGAATDFALRAVADAENGDGPAMSGVMIATCCHHRCSWGAAACRGPASPARTPPDSEVETDPVVGAYVAREFLREAGVDEDSFRLLTAISSWATSTADPAVLRLGEALGEVIDGATRAEWGRRCKRLLDLGRSRYLAARGYAVRLQTYVPQTTVCVELNISLAQNMTTVIA